MSNLVFPNGYEPHPQLWRNASLLLMTAGYATQPEDDSKTAEAADIIAEHILRNHLAPFGARYGFTTEKALGRAATFDAVPPCEYVKGYDIYLIDLIALISGVGPMEVANGDPRAAKGFDAVYDLLTGSAHDDVGAQLFGSSGWDATSAPNLEDCFNTDGPWQQELRDRLSRQPIATGSVTAAAGATSAGGCLVMLTLMFALLAGAIAFIF